MAKIIAPVVTIFNEEEKPDYAGNKKVIDFLIEGGLDGILVLGSAGEFPDLNEQERLDFFRFYAEYVNGRVELLAGTGCIRYADTPVSYTHLDVYKRQGKAKNSGKQRRFPGIPGLFQHVSSHSIRRMPKLRQLKMSIAERSELVNSRGKRGKRRRNGRIGR